MAFIMAKVPSHCPPAPNPNLKELIKRILYYIYKKIQVACFVRSSVFSPWQQTKQGLGAMRRTGSRGCVSEAVRWELSSVCQASFHCAQD